MATALLLWLVNSLQRFVLVRVYESFTYDFREIFMYFFEIRVELFEIASK